MDCSTTKNMLSMLSSLLEAGVDSRSKMMAEAVQGLQQQVRQTGTLPTIPSDISMEQMLLLSALMDMAVSYQAIPGESDTVLHFDLIPVVVGLPDTPVDSKIHLTEGKASLAWTRFGGMLMNAFGVTPGSGWVQCVPELLHRSVVAGATLSDILAYPLAVRETIQGRSGRTPVLSKTQATQDQVQAAADVFYLPVVWRGPAVPKSVSTAEYSAALNQLLQSQLESQNLRLLAITTPVPYGKALEAGESLGLRYHAQLGCTKLMQQTSLPPAALTATVTAYTINNQADADDFIIGVTYQGVLDASTVGATVLTPAMGRLSPEEALLEVQSALLTAGLPTITVSATVEKTDLCLSCGMPHLSVPKQAATTVTTVFH